MVGAPSDAHFVQYIAEVEAYYAHHATQGHREGRPTAQLIDISAATGAPSADARRELVEHVRRLAQRHDGSRDGSGAVALVIRQRVVRGVLSALLKLHLTLQFRLFATRADALDWCDQRLPAP